MAGFGAMADEAESADAFSELSDIFAEEDERVKKSESNVLSQNLLASQAASRIGTSILP